MKILNLVSLEQSDIKYQIQKFPDGQQNVVIQGTRRFTINSLELFNERVGKEGIMIKSRLNNFKDLELIICATQSLRNLGVKEIHLYIPYILGARSDRMFEEGGNRYVKDVIAPILNSLNFESVSCIDPHSYVLENCINNFKSITNLELVNFAITDMYEVNEKENYILISPDAGASHKIYKLAEQIGYKGDIITCSKERDTEGKLTKLVIPVNTIVHKDYIIIDDICDGGATFIQIAKTLKPRLHESNKLYLIVTHGIFSKGFEELSKYFDGIYCSNSYSDLRQDNFIGSKYSHDNVKQLNVF